MNDTNKQFGLMVAYLLPGFIGLAGLAPFAPAVAAWLRPLDAAQAGVGPPVYAVLAATTIGMIVSCFRWLTIDQIHHLTGLTPPVWDDRRLKDRLAAFDYLVFSHYVFYQFASNTLVAVVAAYALNRWCSTVRLLGPATDIGMLMLTAALFAASRDALRKYFDRTTRLVGAVPVVQPEASSMYNGNHHQESGGSATGKTQPKPHEKPQPTTGARPVQDVKAQPPPPAK